MQKVVSISLNGIAYQLEEPGFERLRAYLDSAARRLADSPDRHEVMADLEQAIGEKCARALGPHKTVVNVDEVDRILQEMGPVESPDGKATPEGEGEKAAFTEGFPPPPRKRLYQIREGAMWSGLCNGIAAYLNVDPTWVRIGAVVLTFVTSGFALLAYFVLMFIVPVAQTAEDRAAAFGMPFNAEELISRAKKNFERFGQDYRWRREWRRQQRTWNRQWNHMNSQIQQFAATAAPPGNHTASSFARAFLPVAAVIGALIFVLWILAMFSLVLQQTIFGWHLPNGMPMWGGLLLLFAIYMMLSAPLRAVRHGGAQQPAAHAGWGFLHGLLWLGFAVLFFWVAYEYIPAARELMTQLMWAADLTASTISETIS
jgi:phage shock protein PspC (stress-responsive transcriptional regulator)